MPPKTKAKPKGKQPTDWPKLLRTTRMVALAVFGVGAVVGGVFGIGFVDARAAEIRAESTTQIDIKPLEVIDASTKATRSWPPAKEQEYLLDACYAALDEALADPEADLFADAGLANIARVIAASGWVREVPTVVRKRDGLIEVEPDWLLPAAVVRARGFDYLVSTDARPLPIHYRSGLTEHIAILGSRAADDAEALWRRAGPTQTQSGIREPIDDDRLRAGLSVIAAVQTSSWAQQVAAVDVSNHPQGPVELVTDRDTRVVWGAPPGVPAPGEVATDTKLARLERFATNHDYGLRIDAGLPRVEIHLQHVMIDESAAGRTGG